MSEMPSFHLLVASSVGSIILWARMGAAQKLEVYGLGNLWDLFGLSGKTKQILEFLSFIALGLFVTFALAKPSTINQAFAAGLGWTSLMVNYDSVKTRPRRRPQNPSTG